MHRSVTDQKKNMLVKVKATLYLDDAVEEQTILNTQDNAKNLPFYWSKKLAHETPLNEFCDPEKPFLTVEFPNNSPFDKYFCFPNAQHSGDGGDILKILTDETSRKKFPLLITFDKMKEELKDALQVWNRDKGSEFTSEFEFIPTNKP